jgi:hypothetical protein
LAVKNQLREETILKGTATILVDEFRTSSGR